jgi:hypothetical protein
VDDYSSARALAESHRERRDGNNGPEIRRSGMGAGGSTRRESVERTQERNRDQLLQDEAQYGVAFVDGAGYRVDPEQVFKSVVNTYKDWQGRPVTLWHSEATI